MPIIIGATGIVTRSLKKNLEAVPGKHSIDSLQKIAILGTSHIIWKVLQSNLKPERSSSPLVQEKYRGEKACDKRHPYHIIITTTTTTTTTIIIIIIVDVR